MAATDLTALVTAPLTLQASVDTMLSDIGAALADHGVFTRTLPFAAAAPNEKLLHALIMHMRDGGIPSFILDCNAKSDMVLEARDGRVLTIHDGWNIPLVAFMVDHPAGHIDHLLRAPQKGLITAIDARHLDFLEKLDIQPVGRIFCPHGGPRPIPVMRDAADRPIDILFIGNIGDDPPLDAWLDGMAAGDADLRSALTEAHEAVREGNSDPYAALVPAFERIGRDSSARALAPLIPPLEGYVARVRRAEVLAAITSRRVTILGTVGPESAARLAHHDLRGAASFAQGVRLMAEAKIVLNTRITFSGGAHERIFYGLSRGAVVATEQSDFLAEELENQLGMVMLPKDAQATDRLLDGLLAAPANLDAIRARGLPHYARHHTWFERAGRILKGLVEAGLVAA